MTSAFAEAFEAELSGDARAILAYARKWGEPFTRTEIADIAPGAAWDPLSRWPRTVAKPDPIRELLRAGLIEQCGTGQSRGTRRHGGNPYKIYQLTGADAPMSLAELLDELIDFDTPAPRRTEVHAEILTRFGRPGGAP